MDELKIKSDSYDQAMQQVRKLREGQRVMREAIRGELHAVGKTTGPRERAVLRGYDTTDAESRRIERNKRKRGK